MAESASRTDPGVLRRRLARLAQLGIVRGYTVTPPGAVAHPLAYRVTTTAGDVQTASRSHLPAYLDGLAHGAHAARQDPEVGGL